MGAVRGIYAILDHPHPRGLDVRDVAAAMLAGGARTIQLRAKGQSTARRLELVARIGPSCEQAGAALWINDDLDAAMQAGSAVAGVHLGQRDLEAQPGGWRARLAEAGLPLGLSTHDAAQLALASEHAPAYVGFGPVFATQTKTDTERVVGVRGLRHACTSTSLPVIAIGGIDVARAPACLDAGAVAVAAIGALSGDTARAIELATRAMVRACERIQRSL